MGQGSWSGPHIFERKVPHPTKVEYKVKFQERVDPTFEEERKGKGAHIVSSEHRCSEEDVRKRNAHLQTVDFLIFGHGEGPSGETGRALAEARIREGIRDIAGRMTTGQTVSFFNKGDGKH